MIKFLLCSALAFSLTNTVFISHSNAKEQTTCPIMKGNKVDKKIFSEFEGKKIYFCCDDCKTSFEKMKKNEKETMIKSMEKDGTVLK